MSTCLRALRTAARLFVLALSLGTLPMLATSPARAAASDGAPVVQAATSGPTLPDASTADSTLMVFNRPVVRFRASLPGVSPAERARRAEEEVLRVIGEGGPGVVSAAPFANGKIVMIDDVGVFQLLPDDLDRGQTEDGVLRALKQAMDETHEARSVTRQLRGAGFALLATLILAAAVWLLLRLRRRLLAALAGVGQRQSKRLALAGRTLLSTDRILTLARAITALVYYAILLILIEQWLGFVLRLFPYTRRWGERLNDSGIALAGQLLGAVASSLPGLAVAVVIFFVARVVLKLLSPFFTQVERGELSLPWLDRHTVRATRGLVQIGVWLFALAMAYPYLPGAQTEAFRGISVVIGLMLSLGSSNIIGQAISGLIMIYSRTLHVGEYVRIGDVEGTVTEMAAFAIRVRTGLGEELTLPNSLIVNAVTKNYSRAVKGTGYIVDTVLTIGYDTPWRQVHAMMIEAARRTEGVLESPAPHVFQTALSDFYVEYRVVAQAVVSAPRPRAQVLTDLHSNLQDVFNENGVQIMSPHYLGDPPDAKVVPPTQWNPSLVDTRPPIHPQRKT